MSYFKENLVTFAKPTYSELPPVSGVSLLKANDPKSKNSLQASASLQQHSIAARRVLNKKEVVQHQKMVTKLVENTQLSEADCEKKSSDQLSLTSKLLCF
jgi:hypothetical protein